MGGNNDGGYDAKALGGKFGQKLTGFLDKPAPFYPKALWSGPGTETQTGLMDLWKSGDPNSDYAKGVGGAISEFGDIASGKRFGMNDPGYAAVRAGVENDAIIGANSPFLNNGRFGAGSHAKKLGEGLGTALGALDYGNYQSDVARQQQAAGMLPGLYQASQLPGQTRLSVGQTMDDNRNKGLMAEADLYDRSQNADYNRFLQLLGAFSGTGNAPGMEEKPDFWQMLLGGLGATAGLAGRFTGGLFG